MTGRLGPIDNTIAARLQPRRRAGEPVAVAWERYADAVVAFNVERTVRSAQALARSYRSFVSLFVNAGDYGADVVELHPGGDAS